MNKNQTDLRNQQSDSKSKKQVIQIDPISTKEKLKEQLEKPEEFELKSNIQRRPQFRLNENMKRRFC
ncbi:MAG: hypothetical protein WD048_12300 [Chitinophagales bacterium]